MKFADKHEDTSEKKKKKKKKRQKTYSREIRMYQLGKGFEPAPATATAPSNSEWATQLPKKGISWNNVVLPGKKVLHTWEFWWILS